MSKHLRVSLVGAWHVHANDYARDCANNPDSQLVSVWDDDPERGRQAAEKWDVPYEPDLNAILADSELDGVIITTATSQHREVIEKVIAAGKHIYTEKVLAASVEDAKAISTAAANAGVILTVSLPRLYTGYTKAIEDILATGELGDPSYIRVRVSHDGAVKREGKPQWLPETFFDRSQAMGGAMIDFGAHPYYLVHRFAGLPESISANYLSVSGHEVEDQALIVCNYPNKLTGVAEASFLGGAIGMWIEIHGSNGSLLFDSDEGLRTKIRGDAGWTQLDIPADGVTPFDRWVDHVQRGEQDPENVAEALALTKMAAAAEQSAAEGRTVKIDA